jgi:hypothetical protein
LSRSRSKAAMSSDHKHNATAGRMCVPDIVALYHALSNAIYFENGYLTPITLAVMEMGVAWAAVMPSEAAT